MNTIGIVLINYNSDRATKECLSSLEKLTVGDNQVYVVVVDNNSHLESREKAKYAVEEKKRKNMDFVFITNSENLGFSGGNNVGIRYLLEHGAEYIMLLNNDTLVKESLIIELLQGFSLHDRAGIVVPKIYFEKGHEYHKEKYKASDLGKVLWYAGGRIDFNHIVGIHRGVDEVDTHQYDTNETTQFASGCCMLIKREVLETVGLLDEKYFLYYEDADYSEKVKLAGYSIWYIPDAIVWHKNASSTGGSGSKVQDYFISRNRMIFGMHYAPLRTRIALIRESIRILQSGREWQRRGIQDYYLHRFGKGRYE